ncbi:MAG: hypothetical protein OEV92_03970 [Nitrospinota bacterium]|nr:hypothetical protein [Nitrospinota bacterium]
MDATVFLKLLGALGGRKFVLGVLNSILLPVLAVYLPPDVAQTVVTAVAAVAGVVIASMGYADGQSGGDTSTVAMLKRG